MPRTEEKRLPRWPLWVALSLLVVFEAFFVVMLVLEWKVGNLPLIANSVGLIVFCVLIWRGIPWSRWLLLAFLVWRVARIGVSAVSHFGPGDHRLGGTLILLTFYVVVGSIAASPLGRQRLRAAT